MLILTGEQKRKLTANGRSANAGGKALDIPPVVRLQGIDAEGNPTSESHLIVAMNEYGMLLGLIDRGPGVPYIGLMTMREVADYKELTGTSLVVDPDFQPTATLWQYAEVARKAGHIVTELAQPA